MCSTVTSLMMNLTGKQHTTSDQHKEFGDSRQTRDCSDTQKVVDYLENVTPFNGDPNILRNVETGVSAGNKVNVHQAKLVGDKIVSAMSGNAVSEYTPRKVNQCIVMTSKCPSLNDDKQTMVDPVLLFQRLTTVARRYQNDEAEYFKYELCSHPLSLFDKNCLLRSAEKHELAKAIAVGEL
jgi:hypothetical protein